MEFRHPVTLAGGIPLLRDPIAGSLLLLLRSPPSRRHFRFFHQNTEKRGKKALKE